MSKRRYRSNKTIDAMQWDGSNTDEVKEFLGDKGHGYELSHSGTCIHIGTDWGTLRVWNSDFVTIDNEGHVSHNSAITFMTYYSPIDEAV